VSMHAMNDKGPTTKAAPLAVTVRNGDAVEVLIDHMWWHATITGCARASVRVRLFGADVPGAVGFPAGDAILSAALYGKTWRLSTRGVHAVPLTGQGVRNLNMAAPPALRNGRHFRKPRNWIAICPHPWHEISEEIIEEPVYKPQFDSYGKPTGADYLAFKLHFQICNDCGAEVPA
jgi:hypothetical protein